MNRRSTCRKVLTAGAVFVFLLPLAAGPPEEHTDPDFVLRSEVRLVLLDVSVQDRRGGFAKGLSQENFSVFENGLAQPITVFADTDLPVTVGVLVDESRSMAPKRSQVISAAEAFIRASNPRDEVFVLNFNDTVKRGLPKGVLFSDDIQQLRSALFKGVPQGRTSLNDAIVAGLDQLEQGRRDKKTLIVISDGGDNASQHTRHEMLNRVERSIATIYTIGLFDKDDPDTNPGILKQLARISGGKVFFPTDPSQMPGVCRDIAKDIRTRYTIGYLPRPGSGTNSIRRVRVRVSAKGGTKLIARTRTSYRYEEVENTIDKN